MRFRDFLRMAVLLFGGAATALAVVSIVGAARDSDTTLALVAVGWWAAAAIIGLYLGRGASTTAGIARLLAGARSSTSLPELEPGAVMFNRMWALGAITLVAGGAGFFFPQVPAIATGYALIAALSWRRQHAAVAAIELRDGVEFWFDRSSPFGGPRLLRLQGMRKIEPQAGSERKAPAPVRSSG
jgi:hypothetical protein